MNADADAAVRTPLRTGRPHGPVHRFELAAVAGVWRRELALYRRYWTTTTFASVVEPTIYLLAFGFGFGSLVGVVAGYRYIDFVGTGVVATAVLFTSAFPGMFSTYVRRTFQHTYDGMLSTPVDTHELVTAEATWIAAKSGVYGCAPLLVAMAFGLPPAPTMLLVPLIAFVTGLGFGLFGILVSALVPSINSFDYIISGVLTPLFLVAGTFFPLDQLPPWVAVLAQFNPLYHCVELVRHAVFGPQPLADLGHVGALLLFAALMWVLAVWRMRRKLID
ncbi:ABC transporter permease [Allonocardiopsis opalescens]|uniref:Transport permease protein n=1 Tax=Allonocardiopsis opalescens TaxID=1144618 RepID=A0A2T0QD90_9ACTN|nr:ABC transporter permease [Allonocardiopsis opalescens]PRY01914.1 lipooligosaccharide transport system permease protein [Allonocardiopsis opalescens]